MILGFKLTFPAKLPTPLPTVVINIHSPEDPVESRAIVQHDPNNSTDGNALHDRDHVILISGVFSPACHSCFSKK
jgi:hypothetical protein